MSDNLKIDGEKMQCPFCEGWFAIARQPDGEPAVIHTVPMCVKFEREDLVDYLHAVNEHRDSATN